MDAVSIEKELEELFPTGGEREDIGPIKGRCDSLTSRIQDAWYSLPEALQQRIRDIELAVCKRGQSFALHVEPWVKDDDLESLEDLA